jgi:hypothetical protein
MKSDGTIGSQRCGAMCDRTGMRLATGAALAIGVLLAHPALAEEGMVIWKNHDCGYLILQMKAGYGIYEWMAGPQPNDGDVLEGDFRSPGERRINNKTADLPTTVSVAALAPSRAAIAAHIPAKCKALPSYIPFEGN